MEKGAVIMDNTIVQPSKVAQYLNFYSITPALKEIMDIVKVENKFFKPHPIQRTQKESILSIYKKIHIRLKSKQNTVEGYVK